ncbi:MAG: HAD family hydrolase, partial [Cellulosilyticaceae bacterium]
MKKAYKAVLFDLDGTLIDSMWVWEKIDEVFLGKYNITPPKDMDSVLEGKSFTETATYFKERFRLDESVEAIKDCWNQLAWEFYTQQVPLKPGVASFLDYLKEKNIKMGIATSNSVELVTAVLEHLGIQGYFETVRTSCEVEKGKPHPYIYLKVAEELGVAPEDCLVFEDVPNGVRAGLNAGMDVWA